MSADISTPSSARPTLSPVNNSDTSLKLGTPAILETPPFAKDLPLALRRAHRSNAGLRKEPYILLPEKFETSISKSKDLKITLKRKLDSTSNSNKNEKRKSVGEREDYVPSSRKKKKIPKRLRDQDSSNDFYCWICHREGSMICCDLCPRVYHSKCLQLAEDPDGDWFCPECQKIMKAECVESQSRAMAMLSVDQLSRLLIFSLQRMKHTWAQPFMKPVDADAIQDYYEYIFHPMDLSTLEKNIKSKKYGSTDAFLADAKWILHNCIIYNGSNHKLTNNAKMIIKICKHEMSEIEVCEDCYLSSCIKRENWFCEPCREPHPLVWARLQGFPFWPAKALQTKKGQVDVRFFGQHDRAWVPVANCYKISEEIPCPAKKKTNGLNSAITEMTLHIEKIRKKFGNFEYAPHRTSYDPKISNLKKNNALSEKSSKSNKANSIFRNTPILSIKKEPLEESDKLIIVDEEISLKLTKTESEDPNKKPTDNGKMKKKDIQKKIDEKKVGHIENTSSKGTEKDKVINNTKIFNSEKVENSRKTNDIKDTKKSDNTNKTEDEKETKDIEKSTNITKGNSTKVKQNDSDNVSTEKCESDKLVETFEENEIKQKKPDQTEEPRNEDINNDNPVSSPEQNDVSTKNGPNKSGIESDKSGIDSDKSGIDSDKSGIESNKSGIESNKSEIEQSTTMSSEKKSLDETKLVEENQKESQKDTIDKVTENVEKEIEKTSNNDVEMNEGTDEREEKMETSNDISESKKNDDETKVKDIEEEKLDKEEKNGSSKRNSFMEKLGKTIESCKAILGLKAEVEDKEVEMQTESESEESERESESSDEDIEEIGYEVRRKRSCSSEEPMEVNNDSSEKNGKCSPTIEDELKESCTNESKTPEQDKVTVDKDDSVFQDKIDGKDASKENEQNSVEPDFVLPETNNEVGPELEIVETKQNNDKKDDNQVEIDKKEDEKQQSSESIETQESTENDLKIELNESKQERKLENDEVFDHVKDIVDLVNQQTPTKGDSCKNQDKNVLPKIVTEDDEDEPKTSKKQDKPENFGQIAARIRNFDKYIGKVSHVVKETLIEMYSEVAENSVEEETKKVLKGYQEEVDFLKWRHTRELEEFKHVAALTISEMRSTFDHDKSKALEALKKQMETEKQKEVEQTKKKQWCANCVKEAVFYCCWNTSYCDYPCQQKHWPVHMSTCQQLGSADNAEKSNKQPVMPIQSSVMNPNPNDAMRSNNQQLTSLPHPVQIIPSASATQNKMQTLIHYVQAPPGATLQTAPIQNPRLPPPNQAGLYRLEPVQQFPVLRPQNLIRSMVGPRGQQVILRPNMLHVPNINQRL